MELREDKKLSLLSPFADNLKSSGRSVFSTQSSSCVALSGSNARLIVHVVRSLPGLFDFLRPFDPHIRSIVSAI